MKLSDYARNGTSQFGEDGIIDHVFDVIGIESRVCVEFGASDGLDCSNTASLWREGWKAVLIEADPERVKALRRNTRDVRNTLAVEQCILPTGPQSVDQLLKNRGIEAVDFMSIDIDGNDYWVWREMKIRPRLLCIEYNFTVPPHIDAQQSDGNAGFGASASALVALGQHKNYTFIGLTHSDLFFVPNELAESFEGYERDLATLLPPENFTYVVTDYSGHVGAVGPKPPFGMGSHLVDITDVYAVGCDSVRIVDGFEARFNCPALYLRVENWYHIDYRRSEEPTTQDKAHVHLEAYLNAKIPCVCIETIHVDDHSRLQWITDLAGQFGYDVFQLGTVIGLVEHEVAIYGGVI